MSRGTAPSCAVRLVLELGGLLLASMSAQVYGQTLTTLASFNVSNGADPSARVTLNGNTLYGTAADGGAYGYGTVFSVPLSGGSATVLASFNGNNGDGPQAGLTLSGNTLYGTTFAGSNGDGEVFSVPLSGGSATVLASFNGSNGDGPQAGLTLIGNTLYGTTLHGGANNDGTVFSVPLSGGSATVLVSFNVSNGYEPDAGLTVSGNALYGTTAGGGAYGYGTVFSVPVSGGSATVLASFNRSNGDGPQAGLTLIGNTLYGTTCYGGNLSMNNGAGGGVVYSVPLSGGSVTVLASFNGSDGNRPQAGLTLSGSTLYGTTYEGGNLSLNGGAGDGTVFSVPLSGGSVTVLAAFNGSNGWSPQAGLTLGGDTLYGTTLDGGAYQDGNVFALSIAPAIIALGRGSGVTIISGGTAALGMTVSNSAASGASNLNYTLTAAVLSGSATLGAITSGTGSLAPGGSQSCTVSATSTALGVTTISFTGSDPNASNSPQMTTAALTVLDHAAAAFTNSSTVLTLSFGTMHIGSGTQDLQYQIENLPAAYRAGLALESVMAFSDPGGVFSTDAAPSPTCLPARRAGSSICSSIRRNSATSPASMSSISRTNRTSAAGPAGKR